MGNAGCSALQVTREENGASGYDWSVTFLSDFEPSATSSRLMVSYNGLAGALDGDVTAEVRKTKQNFALLLLACVATGLSLLLLPSAWTVPRSSLLESMVSGIATTDGVGRSSASLLCFGDTFVFLFLQVGYDLNAGLPGHVGVVTVAAVGGEHNLSVSSWQSGSLAAGLFIELDGEAYEIEAVDASNATFTLVEVRR